MNKYKVKVTHVFAEVLDVEADNEEDAKSKVHDQLQNQERSAMPHYETTLPSEHWRVITEEKYNEMIKKFEAELAKEKEGNKEPSNIITP
jgi:FtsZ-interacting cell division protein YlmF